MQKKIVPVNVARRNILSYRCGDCLHYSRVAKFGKPCQELGVKRFADAPVCFSMNPYVLSKLSPNRLYQLGLLLYNLSASERRILLGLMKDSTVMKKNFELDFGQPVFFWIGVDYLSNYFRGYVLAASNHGGSVVYVTSDLNANQRHAPVIATLFRENVYSIKGFAKKKRELIAEGKIKAPNPAIGISNKKTDAEAYEVPTLDKAPPELIERATKKTTLKKRPPVKELDGKLEFKIDRYSESRA